MCTYQKHADLQIMNFHQLNTSVSPAPNQESEFASPPETPLCFLPVITPRLTTVPMTLTAQTGLVCLCPKKTTSRQTILLSTAQTYIHFDWLMINGFN